MAASPARERIVRTGWVEDRDLAALYGGASVLAYPSLYEGFGFPPLQAMRAGVPVVATRAGSVPEVVGDGALLVDPGDTEGLAAALAVLPRRRLGPPGPRGGRVGVGGSLLVGVVRRRARAVVPGRGGGPAWLRRPRPC